ncbi:hypothetical protein MAR_033299 [Mya arenaria]|uniref:Uncharacterized protein n=1 Tax=Mya arenaria TaxID=6604 RepID=A0ABY7G8L4_MYAAR|nr:hypothetical protein MAR_033299 [Mya arenaria]
MSENYYRLLKLLVEPCTRVLLELLETFARNDLVTAGQPFTSIEAYISTKKTFLKSKLGKDQFRTVYPHSGAVDAKKWDISVLCSLSIVLFIPQGHYLHTHITSIRSERNSLSHKTSTTDILDSEFTRIWVALKSNILCVANSAKGSTFQTKISEEIDVLETSAIDPVSRLKLLETWNETLTKSFNGNMLLLQRKISGQTGVMRQLSKRVNVHKSITVRLRSNFESLDKSSKVMCRTIKKQKVKIEQMHEKIVILKETSENSSLILNKTVTKRRSLIGGKICKSMRTENKYEERFKERFHSTLDRCLPDDFNPPKQIDTIVDNLTTRRFVVVSGHENTVYLQTALKAIKSMKYDENRCVQLTNAADWIHIEPDEISLVLFKDPFGGFFFDKKRSKVMIDELDEIKESRERKYDIVIVTRQERLHDVHSTLGFRLPSVVEVKELNLDNTNSLQTSPSTSAEPRGKLDKCFNNLTELTVCYRNQRNPIPDDEVISEHVENCRQKLKDEHWLFLLGTDHDLIKNIALEIADSYGENEYFMLTNPDHILHFDVKRTNLLVIEHFAGRYRFESYKAHKWLETFDHISAMSCSGQLDVIVTSGQDQMKGCVEEFGELPLFRHVIDVTNKTKVRQREYR